MVSTEMNEELESALQEIAVQDTEIQRACLTTLKKLTENAIKNPSEAKFRQVKMENATFVKKVVNCPGGLVVMVSSGWMPAVNAEGEDIWLLSEEVATNLELALKGLVLRLEQELAKLPASPQPAPAAWQPRPAPAGGAFAAGSWQQNLVNEWHAMGGNDGSDLTFEAAQRFMTGHPHLGNMARDPETMELIRQMLDRGGSTGRGR